MNHKRVRPLYREEGLNLRAIRPRRHVSAAHRAERIPVGAANDAWSMDFVSDVQFDGRRLWVLTVVDTWSRICPVMRVCRSATAMVAIEALEEARHNVGLPRTIRLDQGCQFTSKELDLWAYSNGITLDFSTPGKPTDNASVESFNASVRMECLGMHWFMDLDDAVEKIEDWRCEYNEVRPHSAIGDRAPMSLIQKPQHPVEALKPPEILT